MKVIFLHLFLVTPFIMGCSFESKKNKMPAIYETKTEAEKAAKKFNCSGAHKMGDLWMPCKSHKDHEIHIKDNGNMHKHNH